MGLFDRFRSTHGQGDKGTKAPKHSVDQKKKADDATKAAFKAVPGAGSAKKSEQKSDGKGSKDGKDLLKDSKESKDSPKRLRKDNTGPAYRILLRPVVTEKASLLSASAKYVFEVATSATKLDVRRAVRMLYGQDAVKVNIVRLDGKEVRYGRTMGRTRNWKKAVVSLKPGQKIDVLEA